jgi:hypothetical protein
MSVNQLEYYLDRALEFLAGVFFTMTEQPPSGPGPPHYRGYTIILRHTTVGGTSLDE